MQIKCWQILLCFFFVINIQMWSQDNFRYRRWRLQFEHEHPQKITVVAPDNSKQNYWYFRYTIKNDMNRAIPYMVNIKLTVDKTKPGVSEAEVPGIFDQAQIPLGQDKQKYLSKLKTYYSIDSPVVKKAIYEKLNLLPKVSEIDKKILAALDLQTPRSIMEIKDSVGLSYHEILSRLNNLMVYNFVDSKENNFSVIFIKGTKDSALFMVNGSEKTFKINTQINGWELIYFKEDRAVLKKNDVVKTLSKGMSLGYRYLKTGRISLEHDENTYLINNRLKTITKCVFDNNHKRVIYKIKQRNIAKKSKIEGIAIFSNIAHDINYMAVVVTGLLSPIIREGKVVYIENKALMFGYEKPSNMFKGSEIIRLFEKWVVLSKKAIKY